MSLIAEVLERRWEIYRQRPFWRLVEVFVARIFRGGGDSDSEGMDVGAGVPESEPRPDGPDAHGLLHLQHVTGAAHRLDQFRLPAGDDLFSQVVNINVNDITHGIEIIIPDMFGDHRPGEHPSGVPHEVIQQGEILGGEGRSSRFPVIPSAAPGSRARSATWIRGGAASTRRRSRALILARSS